MISANILSLEERRRAESQGQLSDGSRVHAEAGREKERRNGEQTERGAGVGEQREEAGKGRGGRDS